MSAYGTTPNKDSTITRVRTRTHNSLGNATFRFFFRVSCVSVGAESFPGPAHTLNASAFTTVCIGIGRALIMRISWLCVPQCPAVSRGVCYRCLDVSWKRIVRHFARVRNSVYHSGKWGYMVCLFVFLCNFTSLKVVKMSSDAMFICGALAEESYLFADCQSKITSQKTVDRVIKRW